jgi:hypothetical protein
LSDDVDDNDDDNTNINITRCKVCWVFIIKQFWCCFADIMSPLGTEKTGSDETSDVFSHVTQT